MARHEQQLEWMADFEAYATALDADSSSYSATLARSLSLVLDEFYDGLRTVGVSALTGEGIDELFEVQEGGRLLRVGGSRARGKAMPGDDARGKLYGNLRAA